MKLIIQIPCFNEESTLPQTIADLPIAIPGIDEIELMIIDDGSSDETVNVARSLGVDHILRHTRNRGLAAAFATGIDASLRLGADIVVNTDADNQYCGADIARLVEPILLRQADLVIGDRQTWHMTNFSLFKRALQQLGSYTVGLLAGQTLPDAVSGFRAFSREAAIKLNVVTTFSYTIETLLQAANKGIKMTFVPVGTNAATRKSRLFKSIPHFLMRSTTTMARVYAMFQPLKVFAYLSLTLMLLGAIPIFRFLILYMLGEGDGHVQSLVLGGALFLCGCVGLAFGFIADLIAVNRRLLEVTLEKVRRLEINTGHDDVATWWPLPKEEVDDPNIVTAANSAASISSVRRLAPQKGFTLVELLVAIGIIGVLIALLLPAVQQAREAGRRAECLNNLKQIGVGIMLHESTYEHLPTGGWGKEWAGLPGLGADRLQPGGWIFNTLPFVEQTNVHDLGGISTADLSANGRRLEAPLELFVCPSRRSAELYENERSWQPYFHPMLSKVARSDYAMNGGDRYIHAGSGPDSLSEARNFDWPDMSKSTGVCHQRSQVRLAEIVDGTSNTYLVGEKHLPLDRYYSGEDAGDNESMYSGDDRDLIRYTGDELDPTSHPLSDRFLAGREGEVFGGPHSGGFQVAFCDGSARFVAFSLEQVIHSRLGNRRDGLVAQLP